MVDIEAIVGKNVKKYRNKRGLSQTVLAQLVGYTTPDMIYKLETGSVGVPLRKLQLIADALRIPFLELFHDEQADSRENEDVRILKAVGNLNDQHRTIILNLIEALSDLENFRKVKRGRSRSK
jgi:transcriptional regulator with XRE-family HTH domain